MSVSTLKTSDREPTGTCIVLFRPCHILLLDLKMVEARWLRERDLELHLSFELLEFKRGYESS
jgi:hypothetical protein